MTSTSETVVTRIVDLARALIGVPSRAGIDSCEPILDLLAEWCRANDLPCQLLRSAGAPVGLTLRLSSGAGPSLCLDACVDTAPFGDEARWTHPPTSGWLEGGRLFGRGAADSKIAAAIFLVLAADLRGARLPSTGTLHLLLDADEHTGEFRGVKEFVRATDPLPQAVWLGYPGNHTIVAGSRGFLRARVVVAGVAAHSGSKRKKGVNAILRAAHLVGMLEKLALPPETDPHFGFGPSLTVTAMHAGEGFSVVPDRCELNVDVRLTPTVGASVVRAAVERVVHEFDLAFPGPTGTSIGWEESWPAFRVRDDHPAIAALRAAAEAVFRREVPATVSGPSNIGNYLASLGVSPMAGFGVTYDNVHAADEWCEVASIGLVYEIYRRAVLAFMDAATGS